jgi:RNA-directed DNA polymerase
VCDWDNVYLAYRKARKGKRGRPPAATFEYNLEANLVHLRQELAEKTYTPGDYQYLRISY